ncbi:transcriptional regulator [Chryseobacterium gambrini]|uniref:Transcriptional regulator n=1 Tax=Chryseobacterium gambrini TaxID=373672 RepID=A0AAJ1VI50_9FLAO|nr:MULTISPECIES: transcriptional regulator [Chryseobacterium]MDN4011060.1 transcriptional regulator [Chryseobacterium gambrini]QWA38768.1 transcriptional regulator [Chryseobacterium sp. ZHDP1]
MEEGRIVEVIIAELDLFLIDKIRELRGRAKPYISQVELSQRMGFADGYVGKVENFNSNSRYNIRKIHLAAVALKQESYNDLLPDKILKNDLLYLKLRVNRKRNDTVDFDENGNVIKNYAILEKRVLTDEEVKFFINRRNTGGKK